MKKNELLLFYFLLLPSICFSQQIWNREKYKAIHFATWDYSEGVQSETKKVILNIPIEKLGVDDFFLNFKPLGFNEFSKLPQNYKYSESEISQKYNLYYRELSRRIYAQLLIAKSLDRAFWNDYPEYYQPAFILTKFAVSFVLEQYAAHLKLDNTKMDDEEIYQHLKDNVGLNEFAVNIDWDFCSSKVMSPLCAEVKFQTMPEFFNKLTKVFFNELPSSLPLFEKSLEKELKFSYHQFRRSFIFSKMMTKFSSTQANKNFSKEEEKKYLWNKIVTELWKIQIPRQPIDLCQMSDPTDMLCNFNTQHEVVNTTTFDDIALILSWKL